MPAAGGCTPYTQVKVRDSNGPKDYKSTNWTNGMTKLIGVAYCNMSCPWPEPSHEFNLDVFSG